MTDKTNQLISIVMPVFSEADQIGAVLRDVRAELAGAGAGSLAKP